MRPKVFITGQEGLSLGRQTIAMHRSLQRGFTLIELMITIAVFVILVVLAVPSFVDNIDRRKIVDATEGLAKQVQQARMIAIQANRPITIVFDRADPQWCFGLTDQATCDCRIANDCQVPFSHDLTIVPDNYETLTGSRAQYPDIAMIAAPASLRFEPSRGIRDDPATALETLVLNSPRGLEARIMVNAIGRVSTCSPAGSTNVLGMKTCP